MSFEMRRPCACGSNYGKIERRGLQDVVRCLCGKYQYNAPRTETGERRVTVSAVRGSIKPKQRARIIERANGRCEMCGQRELITVGHLISIKAGVDFGIDPGLLNDDENLIAQCAECNLGQGERPMSLRMAHAILRVRVAWAAAEEVF